VEMSKILQSLG